MIKFVPPICKENNKWDIVGYVLYYLYEALPQVSLTMRDAPTSEGVCF